MGVSINVTIKGFGCGSNLVCESEVESPHWTYTNWGRFHDNVTSALRDAYVCAKDSRNQARDVWEEDVKEGEDSDGYALEEFERRAKLVKRLADLKTYWSGAGDEDGCVWHWESKDKVVECLFEALTVDAACPEPFVERGRLAHVLRYLTVTDGDSVTVA